MSNTYYTTNQELTSLANVIRKKANINSTILFPTDYISKINNLSIGNTYGATANQNDILNGKITYVNGEKIYGNILIKDSMNIIPTKNDQNISINQYLIGPQTIKGDLNLQPNNIKKGISIFNINGQCDNIEPVIERTYLMNSFYENSSLTIIYSKIFEGFPFESVSFPNCSEIRHTAFTECNNLKAVNFPECIYIGDSAFESCTQLVSVSFPKCEIIFSSAFRSCTQLVSVNFPECEEILGFAFQYCTQLTSANFPKCEKISSYAFYSCTQLVFVNFPSCLSILNSAFYSCYSLTSVNFPKCTIIGDYAFTVCRSLTSINFPKCTSIGRETFRNCGSLTAVNFPECISIGQAAFYNDLLLFSINFPKCENICSQAFHSCRHLSSVYLLNSSVAQLSNINVFGFTPISNYTTYNNNQYGKIYVRASLLTQWKTATNWVAYSDRFVGLTDQEIAALS